MNQEQIQSLINRIRNGEHVQVWEISQLKNDAGKPEVKDAFVYALRNDSNPDVRNTAAGALRNHVNEPEVQSAFVYALQNDSEWHIRRGIADALNCYVENDPLSNSTPVKAAYIYALLNDEDHFIRSKAAEALAPYANESAVKNAFMHVLLNNSPDVRYPDMFYISAEILAPHAASDPEINRVMVEAFKNYLKNYPGLHLRHVAARVADWSGEDITKVNFSGLPQLPKVDNRTTVIPDEWCKPKSGLLGIRSSLIGNRATHEDVKPTKARFHDVPAEELERFLSQLSTPQRFGLRMMLKGQLPHSERMNGDWDQPAIQFLPAAESLEIPKLLTDSAAVKKYLSNYHIGLATGDHSNHRDYNGGKALPNSLRGALIREFNGNGLKMPKDLRGSWWNNATAIGADFQGADLSGATLIGVDLSKAKLSGCKLSGARLINCKIDGANLSGAIMDCTWIENCTITDSVMHGGVIQDVIVTTSYINNLTLHGTDENPMMIKGLYLSDSVVLDYALMGNCHVQQIEVHGSAVVGQSNDHVPSVELDCCPLSYYADQPPLRGLSKLILPPNGMIVRQIDCDRQVQQMGAIGSSLVLTVVDGNGQSLGDVPVLEHLAGVQIGYQSPKANRRQPFTRNPQLPMPRQHFLDVAAEHDTAPFQQLLQGAGR